MTWDPSEYSMTIIWCLGGVEESIEVSEQHLLQEARVASASSLLHRREEKRIDIHS